MANDLVEKEAGSNPVPRQRSTHIDAVLMGVRRAICRATGHCRSRASIRRDGDSWLSWCERCDSPLVRVAPGIWRERTCEELTGEPMPARDGTAGIDDCPIGQQSDRISSAGTLSSRTFVSPRGYTVNYFARKHHITRQQARMLIGRIGKDRKKLNAAAEALRTSMGAAAAISVAMSRRGLR